MNHILHAGARSVELGWLLGLTTIVFLLCFLGWTWWAYSSRNRERMDQAARLPLMEDQA
jgi:cbb3-type cytochrome oxidase subunit 3